MGPVPGSYRRKALAGVSWRFAALAGALGSTCILRSVVHGLLNKKGLLETSGELLSALVYPFLVTLPAVVVHNGRLDLVQAACISSHLLRTAAVWCVGLGLAPLAAALKLYFQLYLELILELALSFQDQMPLPIMAVLHGLRQAGYATIIVWQMGGGLYRTVLRAVFNWVLLMVLAWLLEIRMRSGYQRQLRQQQQPAQPCAAARSQLATDDAEFVSSLPSPSKPQDSIASLYCASKTKRLHACPAADRERPVSCDVPSAVKESLFHAGAAQAVPGRHSTVRSLSDCAGDGEAEPYACDAAGHHSVCTADSGDELCGYNRTVDSLAAKAVGPTQLPASACLTTDMASGSTSLLGLDKLVSRPPQTLMQLINEQRSLPYRSNRLPAASVTHVKVEGLELEQLPADLPRLLQRQLSHCMPGVSMAGLALRRGCVMLTLDLLNLGDGSMAGGAEAMRLVMAQLMQSTAMDRGLEDGAIMHIQSPDELMFCQWDAVSGGYLPSPEPAAGALDPASLAAYGLIGTLPTVMCLGDCPPTADGTATHQLTLTVELELPSNCPLHGWQPDGALGSAGVEQEKGAAMHAILLARRLDGGYLPVVMERLSHESNDMPTTTHTSVKVMLTLDAVAPVALSLELWCKQHATGAANELLVWHMPVLALPGNCKEAVAELQQHVTDMGGVQPYRALPFEGHALTSEPSRHAASSLLHDVGLYLTGSRRLAMAPQADTPYALPEAAMSQLGADLLVYAVRQGLGAVAGMIMDTMQQAERPDAAVLSTEPRGLPPKAEWLLLAAGCQPSSMQDEQTSLLHAAMASGNRSILEMVLRWDSLYGGPWWAWPWELEDTKGCTALHVAAAQSASTCIGLLNTLTSTLPAAQIQAARSAWLHCPGSVNLTPAELFAQVSDGPSAGVMWCSPATVSMTQRAPDLDRAVHNSTELLDKSKSLEAGVSGPSAAGSSSTPSVPAASLPLQARTGTSDQSWLGSMVEAWTMHNTQEHRAWAQGQLSGLVRSWAGTMTIMAFVAWYRSIMAGCKLYEAPHIFLHNIAYIPMAIATSGATWLGSWQNWMLAVHAFHAMAYLAKLYVPKEFASAWHTSAHNSADAIYVVALTAVLDQSPLPPLAIAQTCVAYCHGLAYASAGVTHPMLRGFVVHGLALVVTNVARARQLRAYRKWQAAQESNNQSAALAQAGKKAKTE